MISVREVIVVEGRYDKNTLSQIFDAVIMETGGFGIFNDSEKLALLRRLAQARGLVILTDSDGAGFMIRNYLKGSIDPALVKHAYIPDIQGKESRKEHGSKEGTLGVEGMERQVLEDALRRAGATMDGQTSEGGGKLTKADMYALGLSGRAGAAGRRAELLRYLELPEKLSANAMLDVFNALYDRQTLEAALSGI